MGNRCESESSTGVPSLVQFQSAVPPLLFQKWGLGAFRGAWIADSCRIDSVQMRTSFLDSHGHAGQCD